MSDKLGYTQVASRIIVKNETRVYGGRDRISQVWIGTKRKVPGA
jgi:hypothetical protein